MKKAENLAFLKERYYGIYTQLNSQMSEVLSTEIIETKQNTLTLKVFSKDTEKFLHSKYDPEKEAEILVDKYQEEFNEGNHVIFYGTGLGYHINQFISVYNPSSFSIYEPSIDIFSQFINFNSLIKYENLTDIYIENDEESCLINLLTLVEKFGGRISFVFLNSYESLFEKEIFNLKNQLKIVLDNKSSSIKINQAFEKRWLINSVNNFKEVINTPNILLSPYQDVFDDKPVIIVSAGPSLSYEIENIKQIKNKSQAYIFSVGSAINTLVENNVYPDFMCTYDPLEINQLVFQKVIDKGITTIPMLFGSSVGFETLKNYKGPKLHILMSQDTISSHYLKGNLQHNVKVINDAPSIAVVVLQVLLHFKSKPIILVGQNLSYLNNKLYAEGINYKHIPLDANQKDIKDNILIDNVEGEKVYTSKGMLRMKREMELYIESSNALVLNTTVKGAQIEGTQFMPLREVMDKYLLKEKLPPINFDFSISPYNKEKFASIQCTMDKQKEELDFILKKFEKYIGNSDNYANKSKQIKIIDALTRQISENLFFSVFVKPTMNNSLQFLNQQLRIEKNKDINQKYRKIKKLFWGFLSEIKVNVAFITLHYKQLSETLLNYNKDIFSN